MNKKQLHGILNIYLNQFSSIKLAMSTFIFVTFITAIRAKKMILFSNSIHSLDVVSVIIELNSIHPVYKLLDILMWIFPYIIFCMFFGIFLSRNMNDEYLIPRTSSRRVFLYSKIILILIINFIYIIIVLGSNVLGCLLVFNSLDINYSKLNYIFIVLYLFNLSLTFFQTLLKEITNSCIKSFFIISISLVTYCFTQISNFQVSFINLNQHNALNNNTQGMQFITFLSINVLFILSTIIALLLIIKNKDFIAIEKEN